MERVYSKTTLRKRRFTIAVLLIIVGLLLWCLCQEVSDENEVSKAEDSDVFVQALELEEYGVTSVNVSEALFDYLSPSIFKFQNQGKEKEKRTVPFLIRVLAPSIFAYTWQEEEKLVFLDEGDARQPGTVLAQSQEIQTQTAAQSKTEEKYQPDLAQNAENSDSEDMKKLHIKISKGEELSLLQENIFLEQNAFSQEVQDNMLGNTAVTLEELQKRNPLREYDFSIYKQNMTQLIKDFYIIDSSTSADAELLDIDKLTSLDCTLDKNEAGPHILIYHSHSQEGFADSVPGDVNTTIVGAGAKLAEHLEAYGYKVLHHTGVYDKPSRDNAYSNALPGIEKVLADNPTIQVVIDLHRDAVAEGTKLVKEIDGKNYARFMFFNGICRSTKGPITYLNNPYLQENMSFSFQAQVAAESYFPGITRKIYLKAWRYNMHFRPRNMLIELGAQTNTVEEIMNTTEILAFVIDKVLSGQ